MIDPLLLTTVRVDTFDGLCPLTSASGFLFNRDGRLYLVTSGHVLRDEPSRHAPDRLEIELHTDAFDLTRSVRISALLYQDGLGNWRQGMDSGGQVDVAILELDRAVLPGNAVFHTFTPDHLPRRLEDVKIDSSTLIVGFPLGFHDTVHHLPVVRQASIASAFGVRFQGRGYFLTDARTHRGSSGAPVVIRASVGDVAGPLPWILLGIHSARLDMSTRHAVEDESLGLNSAWYADILLALTEPHPVGSPAAAPASGG